MKKVDKKIKNYVGNVNVVNNTSVHKKMIQYMIVVLGVLAFMYVLLLGNMVWNIVERKSLQSETYNLASDVGALELEYLALSSEVDVDMSLAMGFREVKTSYTTVKSLGSLARVSNEI